MGEGEFKKRIRDFFPEYYKSSESHKLIPSETLKTWIEDARNDFPKERQGLCDVADPDKGICIHQPSHSDYQDWRKKWLGNG